MANLRLTLAFAAAALAVLAQIQFIGPAAGQLHSGSANNVVHSGYVQDCDPGCRPGKCNSIPKSVMIREEDFSGNTCTHDCGYYKKHAQGPWGPGTDVAIPALFSFCDWSDCAGVWVGESSALACKSVQLPSSAHVVWVADVGKHHMDYTSGFVRCDWCQVDLEYFTCDECMAGWSLVDGHCVLEATPDEDVCALADGLVTAAETMDAATAANCEVVDADTPWDFGDFCADNELRRDRARQLTDFQACGSTCHSLVLLASAMNLRAQYVLRGDDPTGTPVVPGAPVNRGPQILTVRFFRYGGDGRLELEVVVNDRGINNGEEDDHIIVMHIHTNIDYPEFRDWLRRVLCPNSTTQQWENGMIYLANILAGNRVTQVNWRLLGPNGGAGAAGPPANANANVELGQSTMGHWRRMAVDSTVQAPGAADVLTRGGLSMPSHWAGGSPVLNADDALDTDNHPYNLLEEVQALLMDALQRDDVGVVGDVPEPAPGDDMTAYNAATPTFYINAVSGDVFVPGPDGTNHQAHGLNPDRGGGALRQRRLRGRNQNQNQNQNQRALVGDASTSQVEEAGWEPTADMSTAEHCLFLQDELLMQYEMLGYECTSVAGGEVETGTGGPGLPVVSTFKASANARSTQLVGDLVVVTPENVPANEIQCSVPAASDGDDADMAVCYTLTTMVGLDCAAQDGVTVNFAESYEQSSCSEDCSACFASASAGNEDSVDHDAVLDPEVCGVDGRTYRNACHASCKNAEVASSGACHVEESEEEHLSCYGKDEGFAVRLNSLSIGGSTRLTFSSIEECAAKCDEVPECVGFVENSGYCVFKKSLSTIYSNAAKTVYKKDARCVAFQCYVSQDGAAATGPALSNGVLEYTNFDECSAACSGNDACAGFSHVHLPATRELSGGNDNGATDLEACTGECDSDSQCAEGLKCFQRSSGNAIPGCHGSGGAENWDYCYAPGTTVALSGGNDNGATNLQACIGECDSDSQCAEGLKCFQRSHGETIPGCHGSGGGDNWDYCHVPEPVDHCVLHATTAVAEATDAPTCSTSIFDSSWDSAAADPQADYFSLLQPCETDADCCGSAGMFADCHAGTYCHCRDEAEAQGACLSAGAATGAGSSGGWPTEVEFWARQFGSTSSTCDAQCPEGNWEACSRTHLDGMA